MLLHEGAGFHALACSCVSVQPLLPVNSSIATAWTADPADTFLGHSGNLLVQAVHGHCMQGQSKSKSVQTCSYAWPAPDLSWAPLRPLLTHSDLSGCSRASRHSSPRHENLAVCRGGHHSAHRPAAAPGQLQILPRGRPDQLCDCDPIPAGTLQLHVCGCLRLPGKPSGTCDSALWAS